MVNAFSMMCRHFTVGLHPINGYLVADRQTDVGVFIDSGRFHDQIGEHITNEGVDLRYIFFTHGHANHTEGLSDFMKHYSPRCYAGEGEVLQVGNLRFSTYRTLGHSPGAISYYCQDRVFSGDALFSGSVGGTASAELARLQIDRVRTCIFSLPDSTLVFRGHGPMTTVAAEKYGNPFFHSRE